jgi:hypothetical protein
VVRGVDWGLQLTLTLTTLRQQKTRSHGDQIREEDNIKVGDKEPELRAGRIAQSMDVAAQR